MADPAFSIEPWALRETAWDPRLLAQTESLFALSNGYLGIRGALEEGAPAAAPGALLNGVFERVPVPGGERGPGEPEMTERIVPVADGFRLCLHLEGEPLDLRRGTLEAHERLLDLRSGTVTRSLRWRSPAGRRVVVHTRRMVSLAEPHLAALTYEVAPLDGRAHIEVRSELLVEADGTAAERDPRAGAALPPGTLEPTLSSAAGARAVLCHRVRRSGHTVGAGMDHLLGGEGAFVTEATERGACLTASADAEPGSPLTIEKLLAYRRGDGGDAAGLAAGVEASLDRARRLGFEGLASLQRDALDSWWARADVEIDGDEHVQQALRFALFHLFQASACAGPEPIAAKGLTGQGYDGHAFWDTESFVLPVLTYCAPKLAREALRWRARTLDAARGKARGLGLRGAAFAWRTISGSECSTYMPAGTAAFHLNAGIADAVVRYVNATEDTAFEREAGAELLVETARMWRSRGHPDGDGIFHIDGVTGPDEYSVLVDDNLYTNAMAQANLRAAADVAERNASAGAAEVSAWRAAANAIALPFDDEFGVHSQDAAFTRHEPFPFERIGEGDYPLLLHVPYVELYRKQVVKQPDLVLALHLRGEAFTRDEKEAAFHYYEPLTVRDSSLSAATNAVIAAELGFARLAYDYLAEATLLDLHDVADNTRDGLHLAALAGGWIAAVAGLAGMRDHSGRLRFAPRLPVPVRRLSFRLAFRGRSLRVEVSPEAALYELEAGEELEIAHFDQQVSVAPGRPARLEIPPESKRDPPHQPSGRAPARHRPDRHLIERDVEAGAGPGRPPAPGPPISEGAP
ncbi:MAG: glycoside hydrolase family 65 protein [Actinobacteria bacterium]|nr:glycoside hydrolase family 65 protein [Actinomycetota bacterium]